eukprot:GILJ01008939.1.p1 GENE.GILJ01008939.1~~GILJ01008939.1.p1  ORF type:complete len:1120 (-),score=140.96 GILJ01008939.1:180-3260(-)
MSEWRDVVLCQTILRILLNSTKTRTHAHLRSLINDERRRWVEFSNENHSATYIKRARHESASLRDDRAILVSAEWYHQHLPATAPRVIVLSESQDMHQQATQRGLECLSCGEYIRRFHPSSAALLDLYESLKQSYQAIAYAEHGVRPAANKGTAEDLSYEDYRSEEALEAGIKSRTLIKGTLRVKKQSSTDEAFIRADDESDDILIQGRFNRNRAIHGDVVAVSLLEDGSVSSSETGSELKVPQRRTAKVVGIFQRNWRPYVCVLQQDQVESKSSFVLAVPMDIRIPKIRIQTRQGGQLINSRIVVHVDGWERDSQYPAGHYVKQLGIIGDPETETQALLIENGVAMPPFSSSALTQLPVSTPDFPWLPEANEIAHRRDLRAARRPFSIDPPNCQDIDDCLHACPLPNGRIEIGVHIADVSFFLKADSPLDLEARARGTSVYLVDRRLDMLPAVLSTDVCSLVQNKDRYAVSTIWELDPQTFEIKKSWAGRTVIRSRYSLSYDVAQALFDGGPPPPVCASKAESDQLRTDLELLVQVGRFMRRRRIIRGAVELEGEEMKFQLATDNKPVGVKTKDDIEMHHIVAEYMIFANEWVAAQIYQSFPAAALLRRHPFPNTSRFKDILDLASVRGESVDVSSNQALARSLLQIKQSDPSLFNVLSAMVTRAMAEAEYFSSGSCVPQDFYHYGLAAPTYTHFTSPIRRYADVIVHRQLLEAVKRDAERTSYSTTQRLQELSQQLNRAHRNAKFAGKESQDMFLSLYLQQRQETVDAVITSIRANGFNIFVPSYNLRGLVYLQDSEGNPTIPLTVFADSMLHRPTDARLSFTVSRSDQRDVLNIYSTSGESRSLQLLDHVTVRLTVEPSRIRIPQIKFELVSAVQTVLNKRPVLHAVAPVRVSALQADHKPELFESPQPINSESSEHHEVPVLKSSRRDLKLYSQTSSELSVYDLLVQFDQLSLEAPGTESTRTYLNRLVELREKPNRKSGGSTVNQVTHLISHSIPTCKTGKRFYRSFGGYTSVVSEDVDGS